MRLLLTACAVALVVLLGGAGAPAVAQDLTITNVRIIGPDASRRRARLDRRARRQDPVGGRRHAVDDGRPDDRRQRHVGHARLHRRAPALQHRPQREGADAGAARGRLHDAPLRRRPRRRQHHAARSHRVGPDQRAAHHPVGRRCASAQHTPESARAEIRKMAAMGVKFTGEICAHAGARPHRAGDGDPPRHRGRRKEGRRDGAGARGQHAGDDGGGRRGRAAARAPSQQGLHEQGRREEAGRVGHEDPRHDRLRRAGLRRVCRRQQAALPRRQAVARVDRRRRAPRRGSRLHAGERPHRVGRRRHPRLLHRHRRTTRRPDSSTSSSRST